VLTEIVQWEILLVQHEMADKLVNAHHPSSQETFFLERN